MLSCFSGLTLTLPQSREAHYHAQFEGLGLLLLRDGSRSEKALFRSRLSLGTRCEVLGVGTWNLESCDWAQGRL